MNESIEAIAGLEKDWDGEGGEPFSKENISFFKSVVSEIQRGPRLSPTSRESLLIDYEKEDRSYLGFELFADRMSVLVLFQEEYGKARTYQVTSDFVSCINAELDKFYKEDPVTEHDK